jgi:hypothetical protein
MSWRHRNRRGGEPGTRSSGSGSSLWSSGRVPIPTPEKNRFEAEGILPERALTKCIQRRDETLRQLRDAARRVDKAAFKDQSDFGPAHQALLNVCDRVADIID